MWSGFDSLGNGLRPCLWLNRATGYEKKGLSPLGDNYAALGKLSVLGVRWGEGVDSYFAKSKRAKKPEKAVEGRTSTKIMSVCVKAVMERGKARSKVKCNSTRRGVQTERRHSLHSLAASSINQARKEKQRQPFPLCFLSRKTTNHACNISMTACSYFGDVDTTTPGTKHDSAPAATGCTRRTRHPARDEMKRGTAYRHVNQAEKERIKYRKIFTFISSLAL